MHTHLGLWDTDIPIFFLSPRCRLEDVFKTCLQDAFKTCLQDVFKICLKDVFKTYLQNVFKTCFQDVFKTSSAKQFFVFQDAFKTCLQDMSSRRLQRNNFSSSKASCEISSRRLGRRKIVTLKMCWRRLQDISWRPTNVCWVFTHLTRAAIETYLLVLRIKGYQ